MLVSGLKLANLTVRLAWLAGTFALLALIVVPAVLPALGRHMYVVRGGSMEPAIPLGSVVVVHAVEPASVQVGEIVTYRTAQGTVVTHRVTAINDGSERSFETKGDASASADPTPVTASEIVGGVEYTLPGLGFFIYMLSSTQGILLAIGILASLLVVAWSTERLVRSARGQSPPSSMRLAP
jgi:signal peptidase